MRKICVVTATRAEYGLLRPIMQMIKENPFLSLQVLVTGAHLSPEFGLTYKQILADGFEINDKVEMLLSSDTENGIVKTMGLGLIGYADSLSKLKPDLLVVLGDRYEILSIAAAATIFKIPIAHLHGGEITEGAYDDAIRHAITKLSYLHFTSADEYKNRVIQMGENPNRVFNVGAIGLDNVKELKLLSKEELEKDLDFRFNKYNYQITFHPETMSSMSSTEQFEILLKEISLQKDSFFIFTKANADTDGRIINQMIDEYVAKNSDIAIGFHSLGNLRFLSLLQYCDAIVGNSSSGILEAPSLKCATINIGDRQRGRIQAASIINVPCESLPLRAAFDKVKLNDFRTLVSEVNNPYDQGGAVRRIVPILENIDMKDISKIFYDL